MVVMSCTRLKKKVFVFVLHNRLSQQSRTERKVIRADFVEINSIIRLEKFSICFT